jgi:NAD(P)-dependent dehydrogenase (short-subunit alcohol dehydrogenase family)
VVTGANGTGFASARLLARRCGSSMWRARIRGGGAADRAGAIADVTDRASLEAAFDTCGTPDILVADAGTEGDFCEDTAEEWERIPAVNLSGAFHSMQAAARRMREPRSCRVADTPRQIPPQNRQSAALPA